VTRAEGLPSAVLVRALEPLDGIELMHKRRPRTKHTADLTNGPGKLCAALGITGAINGLSLRRKPIVIREGEPIGESDIAVTTRIGIAPARSADWPLRWIVKNNRFVSHPVRPKKS
jgi:DNA-3-methyladenine glycosylase